MAWLEGTEYFWVVLCKNRGFHNKYNLFSKHAIPLAEADEISPPTQVKAFTVRCDDCGAEHTYEAKDVLRAELYEVGAFTTHPLFDQSTLRDGDKQAAVSTSSRAKTAVLDRVRTALAPYLRFRRKETLPPRWRR